MMFVKKSKKYRFDVSNWHNPGEDGICNVCVAGAVMARTLKAPHNKWVSPMNYIRGKWYAKFKIIDHIRTNNRSGVAHYLNFLGWSTPNFDYMYEGIKLNLLERGDNKSWLKLIDNLKEHYDSSNRS